MMPNNDHNHQGTLGDCYFLAALALAVEGDTEHVVLARHWVRRAYLAEQ